MPDSKFVWNLDDIDLEVPEPDEISEAEAEEVDLGDVPIPQRPEQQKARRIRDEDEGSS